MKNRMNKRRKIFHTPLRICIYFIVSISVYCASKSSQWKSELLFSNKQLENTARTTGHSVLVLPIIKDNSFDSSQAVSPEKFTKALMREKETIKVYFQKDFEESFILKHGKELLDSFYTSLCKNDILALNALDTVWKNLPGEYLITIRLSTGVRIRSFDDIVKRKAQLESELWDIKRVEVVWRAQSSGYEMNVKVTDAEFIINGIKNICTLMPDFIPIREEENW